MSREILFGEKAGTILGLCPMGAKEIPVRAVDTMSNIMEAGGPDG